MLAFLVRRLLLTLPILWIVVSLVFGLIHMVPGDPVAQMLGEGASVTEVARLRHELGLDRSLLEQYRTYMTGLLHGDMGVSFRNQEPVASSILSRYPATMELDVGGNPAGLCSDRASERSFGKGRPFSSRAEKRSDSCPYNRWLANGCDDGRGDDCRNDLFMAGTRAIDDSGNIRERLSAGAGM